MKRTSKVLSLLLIIALAMSACGGASEKKEQAGNESKEELTKITIGVSPFQDTLLPIIGEEKGWFEEEGLDVSFEMLAWNAVMPALASGSVDVAVYNTTGIVSGHNKMEEAIFLYPWNIFTEGQAMMGRPAVGFKTVEDFEAEGMSHEDAVKETALQLKGKTIVTTMGSDMGKSVIEVTENNGIAREDFEVIDMDPDQGLAAFISGTGDAYVGGIPQRTRLEKEGYTTMLVGPDLAPVPINGWISTDSFTKENEEALLKLQHVMFKVIRYTEENMEEVGNIITDKINSETGAGMTVDQFEKYFTEIEDFPGNAALVNENILDEKGFGYWKRTWDNDNKYFVEVDKLIPKEVPYSAFKGEEFQQKYLDKYGADESGY